MDNLKDIIVQRFGIERFYIPGDFGCSRSEWSKFLTEEINRDMNKDQRLIWVTLDPNGDFDGDCFFNKSWHSVEDTKK